MSAAPALKAAKVPPSSFAALLRRSKFSSYDPGIGQIYTTYGGSAARGDWGLKRPLAVRRRDARLTVRNIDTLYQQTEWKSAYSDAEWVRKFEEMGVALTIDNRGGWAPRFSASDPKCLHDYDSLSRSGQASRAAYLERTKPLPDPRAMGEKRFERYLRRVRRFSPEFEPFLKAEMDRKEQGRKERERQGVVTTLDPAPSPPRKPFYEQAKNEFTRDHRSFLAAKFANECNALNSTAIRPLPHPTAGLTYAPMPDLQTALTSKPLPGRVLGELDRRGTSSVAHNVAVAGWIGKGEALKRDNVSVTDWGTKDGEPRKDVEAGKGVFRPTACALVSPPEVVGENPQGMSSASFRMTFMNWEDVNKVRPNPHRPGTAEYVAHQERDHTRRAISPSPLSSYGGGNSMPNYSMTYPRKPVEKSKEQTKDEASGLLSKLRAFLPDVKKSPNNEKL